MQGEYGKVFDVTGYKKIRVDAQDLRDLNSPEFLDWVFQVVKLNLFPNSDDVRIRISDKVKRLHWGDNNEEIT